MAGDFISDEEMAKLDNTSGDFISDDDMQKLESGPDVSYLESGARGLAQGASFGFADEITGALESAFSDKTYEQARDESRKNYKSAQDANPLTYGAGEIGGAAGTMLIPGGGASSLVRMALRGATEGAAYGLGHSEADNLQGLVQDAGVGAIIGGAGGAVSKGVSSAMDALPAAGKFIGQAADDIKIGPKSNAAEIEAAAKSLGIKPTKGMLTDSKFIQGLESSLNQSPSFAGSRLQKQSIDPLYEGLESFMKSATADASGLSPFQVGEKLKSGITASVGERLAPSKMIFEEVAEQTKNIPLSARSLESVARNLSKIEGVSLAPSSSWAGKANQYAEMIRNAKNANDIKTIKTLAQQELRAASGPDRQVLGEIVDKVGRLESNSIMRGAIEAAREAEPARIAGKFRSKADIDAGAVESGTEIGRDLIGELLEARKSYGTEQRALRDFSQAAGLPKNAQSGHSSFLNAIDNMKSESVGQKLFNTDNFAGLTALKQQFPEQFEALRKSELNSIVQSATGPDGKLSPAKFVTATKNLGPEARQMLFGDLAPKIDSFQKVVQNIPAKVGPSGTPQGMAFMDTINPVFQGKEALRYGVYNQGQKIASGADKIAEVLKNSPQSFGKYAKPLMSAAQRGGNALSANHYILQSTDPEYREQMNNLFGKAEGD